jgi:uncharacterized ferritin-like protein (DUF455 family)
MKRSRASFAWGESEIFPESPQPEDGNVTETPTTLAERVLFSTDLVEKLRPAPLAGEISPTDEIRIPCGKGLTPGRPAELRFAPFGSERPALPARPGLVNEANRGVLLHFFANHELLAAELMALALLKFPDAPAAFRHGLAETLREEQRHTRWYLARMRECGVEFGQYPLSGYFWDAVSPMESPLDYVSRLSLTFEQANLDYARHFSAILAEAGDPKSASILRKIYEDEIQHVGYGLHWFRQWKDPSESDWSALQKRLPFPLSPSRAKGNRTGFNEEGRRAAGFDEDYIRQLACFERSKGRTPNVFFFNPEAEHRAARWPAVYHPDATRLAIVDDLELLAGFLARRDDVLLLRRAPSPAHLEKLARCGFALPEIELLSPTGSVDPAGLLASRKVDRLRPWAIAPDLADRFAPLRNVSREGLARAPWSGEIRSLFSKIDQVGALARWMGPSIPCLSARELAGAATSLRAAGSRDFVLKRAFSTAGSGINAIRDEEIPALADRPFSPAVEAEGGILLEPRQDRVFDFSVQYRLEGGRMHLAGFVEQRIEGLGGYRGSICRSKFCRGLDAELARFLMEQCLPLYDAEGPLAADVAAWAGARGFEGSLGLDAYVHRDSSGQLRHRPICEVNPRHTMGLVALELKRRITPGRDLAFRLLRARNLDPGDDQPVLDSEGRMRAGSLLLTEPRDANSLVAVIAILESNLM